MSDGTTRVVRLIANARDIATLAREAYLEAEQTPLDDAFSTLISAFNELCDGVEALTGWVSAEENEAVALTAEAIRRWAREVPV